MESQKIRHYCVICKRKRYEKFMECLGMNQNCQYSWKCKTCLAPGSGHYL